MSKILIECGIKKWVVPPYFCEIDTYALQISRSIRRWVSHISRQCEEEVMHGWCEYRKGCKSMRRMHLFEGLETMYFGSSKSVECFCGWL